MMTSEKSVKRTEDGGTLAKGRGKTCSASGREDNFAVIGVPSGADAPAIPGTPVQTAFSGVSETSGTPETPEKKLGLYLHIPFCVRKCRYCDFCSFPGMGTDVMDLYTRRLAEEVIRASRKYRGYTVDTVYFGGGTPTLLPFPLFFRVMETVYRCFRVENDAEITMECNPATANGEYLMGIRREGVNRLSIGLQSADDRELAALGRIHTFGDFLTTYDAARRAGFDNISADLMFGIPEQTRESFRDTLRRVTALYPEHLSVYGLILEEGTPFYRMRDTLALPDEDTESDMYRDAVAFLHERGYDRYEISNFSRRGRVSRHNYRYWDCREYLGFGVAAHSYFGGERVSHSRDFDGYLAGRDITDERVTVTEKDARDEYVMLRMRLADGVDETQYRARFGEDFRAHYGVRLEPYIREGFVSADGGRYRFTDSGFYVSNAILSSVLDL